jgi:hypothetical protein
MLLRIEKLEYASGADRHRRRKIHMIFMEYGETTGEIRARYMAEHPEADENDIYYTICWDSSPDQGDKPAPAMQNGRCRMHGGKSTGPRTVEGLERSRKANRKHGHYSAESIARRR